MRVAVGALRGWFYAFVLAFCVAAAASCGGGGDSDAAASDPGADSGGDLETDGSGDAQAVETSSESVDSVPATPEEVTAAFVGAWEAGDFGALGALVDSGQSAEAVSEHQGVNEELVITATTIVAADPAPTEQGLEVPLSVAVHLDGLGTWEYGSTLRLVDRGEVDEQWVVDWAPTTIHPALREGQRLSRRVVWPQRGHLLAADGAPLRTDVDVVAIGIEPRRIDDRDTLLDGLEAILGADPQVVNVALDAPDVQPDWFVPVSTMRESDYRRVQADVEALTGVVVRAGTDRRGPVDGFAAQVLGATGPITAEQLATWGEPYTTSSIVGRSGLELVYELELAGTPSGDIRVLDEAGTMVSVVHRFAGRPPGNIRTTLDADAQLAAERALDAVSEPSALVAIDAATGEIRAAVSRPVDDFGRAFTGAYPPGSTFKTITAAAFLADGATATTTVSCPASVVVTGRPFENAGGGALGAVPLQTAYARSCNTAFVNISERLPDGALADTAALFGFDVPYSVGLSAFGGSLPEPIDDADLAASAIGQGRVTASPLHMASVAAAASDGAWRTPVLVSDPPLDVDTDINPLAEAVASQLRLLMRATVTSGTGTAAAAAGGDISGKTGSAEFGDGDPPETHAWFIGYRDGLGVAVLVEGGGAGGSVAAPLVAQFFAGLDAAG